MGFIDYAIGVDIGGTHIDGVCIDGRGRTITKASIPIGNKKLNKKLVIDNMIECIDTLIEGDKPIKPICIGAAVPGTIKDGMVKKSPNLPFLNSTDFKSLLSKRYKTKAVVDNDVNCMAYGEMMRRKGKDIVVLTLGTGIGGGIVIGGKVYRGRSHAGEIGHMTIKLDGSRCKCGNLGCFEEFASVRSVRRLSRKHLGKANDPYDVYKMAKGGNRKARLVWNDYGRMLGVALTNISYILDPDTIVLGGGISKAYELFRDSMIAEMKKRLFIPMPRIVTGMSNGNSYGAACMALKTKA